MIPEGFPAEAVLIEPEGVDQLCEALRGLKGDPARLDTAQRSTY